MLFRSFLCGALVLAPLYADDHDEDDNDDSRGIVVRLIDGQPQIEFDDRSSREFGIESTLPEVYSAVSETLSLAKALSIGPLVAARAEHEALLAERQLLTRRLAQQRQTLGQTEKMRRDGILVDFASLQQLNTDIHQNEARAIAIDSRGEALKNAFRVEWGEYLTGIAFNERDILPGGQYIVVFGLAEVLPTDTKPQIRLESRGKILHEAQVEFLGRSANGHGLAGATYYCIASHPALRSNMRLTARIAADGQTRDGVVVSSSAVVWYGGKPWAFTTKDDRVYVRVELLGIAAVEEGIFVGSGLSPDSRVVVRGAQSLLAEEFRWSIPDEDADE